MLGHGVHQAGSQQLGDNFLLFVCLFEGLRLLAFLYDSRSFSEMSAPRLSGVSKVVRHREALPRKEPWHLPRATRSRGHHTVAEEVPLGRVHHACLTKQLQRLEMKTELFIEKTSDF